MPIWRSSELWSGRPGSPSRRSSARITSSFSNPIPSSGLPPLRKSTDGTAPDDHQLGHAGPSQQAYFQQPQRQASGCGSVNSAGSWDGAPGGSGPVVQPSSRPTSRTESRAQATPGAPSARTSTYTVQYIGIANGELGILSQKQKLSIPVTIPGASSPAPPATNVVWSPRRRSAASGVSAAAAFVRPPSRSAGAVAVAAATPAPAAAAAAAAAPATATSSTSQTPAAEWPSGPLDAAVARPPPGPSRPASAMPLAPRPPAAVMIPDPVEPVVRPYDGLPGTTDESDADSPASIRVRPPSLASIVDDAHGQVKVISECFYSRALHSRAGPRDRHVRLNRPVGPQVRDMEPLSTGLPGCFAHRMPSAGGFPGWKLNGTAAAMGGGGSGSGSPPPAPASDHRRSYTGSNSGRAVARQTSTGRPQRAVSAQPRSASAARTVRARPGTATSVRAVGSAASAVAAAAAAVAHAARRPTDATSGSGAGDEPDLAFGARQGAPRAAVGGRGNLRRVAASSPVDYPDDD